MNPPSAHRFRLARHVGALWVLPAFGLLLIGAVWAATWLQLATTERAVIGVALHDTESLAAEFEQYIERAIENADRSARLVKHEFERNEALDLQGLIRAGLVKGSGLAVVSVSDAKGNLIARSQPAVPFNMADREFFRLHMERDTGLLDISKPVVGKVSGRSTILMSRRLNHADGTFAGVVLVAVTPEYFTGFYQESDLGARGSLGLLGLDGAFRARRGGDDATLLTDESGPRFMARAEVNSVAHYETQGDAEHPAQIVAYRRLADYPFIVIAARATDEALGDFYRNRTIYLIAASAATLAILAFFATVTALAVRLQRNRGELRLQRRFLETLVDNIPSGIAVRSMHPDTFGRYVLWSETNTLIFGPTSSDTLGKTVQEVLSAHDAAHIMALDAELLASPMVQDVEQVREQTDRGRRHFHLIRAPIFGADGQVDYIMTSATDITGERARMDELQLASTVFETTADGIMVSDADDRVIMVNAAFSKLTGYDAPEIVGLILADSPFRPVDPAASDERMAKLNRDGFVTGEVARFRKNGSPLSLWVTASGVRNADNTIRNYVRVFTDISLLKETQKMLEELASVDILTGLPNRRLLLDRLEQATRRAQRSRFGMAVMYVDLDGLKAVNDTLGHSVGDLMLRETALRLQNCIRATDSIGRLGGDEFAIIVEDAQIPLDVVQVGERIVAALALPFVLDGHRITAGASVGIAVYPQDGENAATLLKNADAAMYRAKQAGRSRYGFFARPEDVADVAG